MLALDTKQELAVQWENRSVDHALSPRVQCRPPLPSVPRKQNASCENSLHRMGVCRKPTDRCQSLKPAHDFADTLTALLLQNGTGQVPRGLDLSLPLLETTGAVRSHDPPRRKHIGSKFSASVPSQPTFHERKPFWRA